MVFDMSWFGALPGPAPHPRLSRVSRWCAPHPWDSFVAGFCGYWCFGGPFVLCLLLLAPFLVLPWMWVFLPLLATLYWTMEGAWFVHRWYLRYRQEPFTVPPPNPDREKHMARFLRLKHDVVPSIHDYHSAWFRGACASTIKRENVREFVRYGFFGYTDSSQSSPEDETEIETWLCQVEQVWQITLEPGRTPGLTFMKHMREPLKAFHTPLFVVAYSHLAEMFAGVVLRAWGFTHHTCAGTGVTYWRRGGKSGGDESYVPPTVSASTENNDYGNDSGMNDSSNSVHALSSLERPSGQTRPGSAEVWCRECQVEPREKAGGLLQPLRRSLDLLRRRSGDGKPSVGLAYPKTQSRSQSREGSRNGSSGALFDGVSGCQDTRGTDDNAHKRCFGGCRPPLPPPPPRDPSTPTWAPSPTRSPEPTPAVLLHGLGIGLPPYLWTVGHLLRAKPDRAVVLVCLPEVSIRVRFSVPTPDDLVDAVERLCKKHELWTPCLMGHSFGTFVVARACQRSRVAAAVLVDPVSCCLMLPAVISKVLYQLEDRWRELWGLVKAGATGGGASEDTHSRRRGILHPLVSWRHRFDLVTRFTFTLFRDLLVVRELSCAVALSRKFWWYQVCLWVEDMPRRSLVVLQSYDAILDPDAIAAHVLARDAADVVWVEGFQHGELLGPQGYEARRRVVNFLEALDHERVARDLIGLEQTWGKQQGRKKDGHGGGNDGRRANKPPLAPETNARAFFPA